MSDILKTQKEHVSEMLCKYLEEIDNALIEVVRMFLGWGANPNHKDNYYGSTPLHYASARGYKDICRLLLLCGADRNIKDDDCVKTPLETADNKDVIFLLKNFKAVKHPKIQKRGLRNTIK